MFETSALNNLKLADGITWEDEESIENNVPVSFRNTTSFEHEYPLYFPELVDKSNSCVYSTGSPVKTLVSSKVLPKKLKRGLKGWEVCDRPHVQGTAGNQIPPTNANEAQDTIRRHGKSRSSPALKSFPAMMRLTRHRYRNGARSSSPRIPSRESSKSSNNSDVNASHSSSTGSINSHKVLPIKIGRRFRHFRRNSSYMEQYREEYTYQRLNEFRDFSSLPYYDTHACSCRGCACSPKSSDHRWYPNQSHMEKCNVLPTCEKNPCKTTGAPVPKRTPVLKTRPPPPRKKKQPYVAQIPRLGDAPTCIPKLEFFATSLTVNNYNPVRTPPSPAHRSAPNSASSLIMNCRRGTKSPIHVSTSCVYLLNQNLKGLE